MEVKQVSGRGHWRIGHRGTKCCNPAEGSGAAEMFAYSILSAFADIGIEPLSS